ncbi:TPA: acylneuraminate cytidylyltransferase family protein [Vibrio vulnificus]|uniref:acylneuraminate cytidylyltransferase family protein n=1 Tax=Vibrio vulnificus TaxID=672 RepID=UPI00102CB8E4|nr:acylneuraminate cytidylyltransferase family protein [Vibrio vulnificus]EGR9009175.1 acylneuraminate cytidylyltransferase family protein [Vibrio vulnificus]EHU9459498.1 acylneuraminate cytidylyltransferase family protein [Vibrio vulnificus]EJU9786140.1 acylneuraminate cytidylyltransferase family protein [Vibrio vulnificus]ELY5144871.1 acylneuraminate cytidylyltransferase family protein [Vibrio vulnificus]MBN8146292.1 acylneuraminate cytidylyltransferase family protein [Vibrio vulnificus]
MKILAITPARGGSKRLPGKNIKNLNGKPLIQWTIDAALAVQEIARVMVTTDCDEIAEIAKKAGAEVPFIRPPELATDTSSSSDVIRHALDFYRAQGEEFDFVLLLQPTSPIRSADDIRHAIEQLKAHTADAVVSVCPCDHSPLWANTLPDDRSMADFIRHEVSQLRSQDLPDYYRINGAIYLTRVSRFYQENSLFLSSNIFAYVMDNESSVDIDHELDFLIAETVLKYREQNA